MQGGVQFEVFKYTALNFGQALQKRNPILNQKFYKYVSTTAFCTYNVSSVLYRGITLENIRLLGGAGSTFINN